MRNQTPDFVTFTMHVIILFCSDISSQSKTVLRDIMDDAAQVMQHNMHKLWSAVWD